MKKLQEFVSISNSSLPLLPFMHNTDEITFLEILSDNTLKARKCNVFGIHLLYLFYGIPAYVVASSIQSKPDSSYYPICFILKPEKINMYKVYPFDSGAFENDRFQSAFHQTLKIDNFSLHNNLDNIKNFVETFYTNNENYIAGDSTAIDKINRKDLELIYQQYLSLICSTLETDFDQRCSTVEILTKKDYQIDDIIQAVVLPNIAWDNEEVFNTITSNWKADIITYSTIKRRKPSEYISVIQEKVYEYLKNLKYITSTHRL